MVRGSRRCPAADLTPTWWACLPFPLGEEEEEEEARKVVWEEEEEEGVTVRASVHVVPTKETTALEFL